MRQPHLRRFLCAITALSFVLTAAFGCARRKTYAAPTPTATPAFTTFLGGMSDPASDDDAHSGTFGADGDASEAESGAYASLDANENAVLVQNGGILALKNSDVNKQGDATSAFSGGQNAAVAVTTAGQCTLDGCVVTANALGAFGLYVSGEQSLLDAMNCHVVTSKASSPALVAADGGTLNVTSGTLFAEGTDSPCILSNGNAQITLNSASVTASSGAFLTVAAGTLTLNLIHQTAAGSALIAEDAFLSLHLTSGSAFTGALGDELPARASVSLDETSKWVLTGDTYLSELVNADRTHANIESGGFSIYYDSNLTANAPLNAQSYALPGGGWLVPII